MRLQEEMRSNQYICAFVLFFLLFSTTFAKEKLIIEPDAGRQPILSAIHQAHSSIDLVMYGLTDPTFINTLIAENKIGKKVQVLLEPLPYRSETENQFAITRLRNANIPLQFPSQKVKLIHQKAFIFDNNNAMVMTFNLTRSTFKDQRNFGIMVDDLEMVKEISAVFAADWQHKNIAVHHSNLIWSPDNAREKIIHFIQQTNATLDIYAQDLSDYQTIGALAKAARSGIKIKILLSETANKNENKKFDYLRKAGVTIRFSKKLIHAKVLISDQKHAILGSINLTRPSLERNRELSIITQEPDVVSELESTFIQDWKSAKGSFTQYPEVIFRSKMLLKHAKALLRHSF